MVPIVALFAWYLGRDRNIEEGGVVYFVWRSDGFMSFIFLPKKFGEGVSGRDTLGRNGQRQL